MEFDLELTIGLKRIIDSLQDGRKYAPNVSTPTNIWDKGKNDEDDDLSDTIE